MQRFLRALQVLRLAVLMLLGAGFGQLPKLSHSQAEAAEQHFSGAILGALCGLAIELFLRLFLPVPQGELPAIRFTIRFLLIVTTLIAVALGTLWVVRRYSWH